jgi:hypothetical protein
MAQYGLSAADSQDANPYQRRRKDSYQDEARQRALSTAVTGGRQPQSTELGANQPGGYDRALERQSRENRGRQYDYGQQSRRRIDLGDGSASQRLESQSPSSPYEEGGVTGGAGLDQARQENAAAQAAPATDYTKMGQYGAKMGGWAGDKFQKPWADQSEKYQIGTVLSNFDPKGGVTPEVVAALNAANIHGAQFSGEGDQLKVNNLTGYDRFGSGGTADVVKGLKGNNEDTAWQPWFVDDQAGGGMGGNQQAALGNAIQGGAWGENGAYGSQPWMSRNTQTGGDALQLIYKLLGPLMSQTGLDSGSALSALLGSAGGKL